MATSFFDVNIRLFAVLLGINKYLNHGYNLHSLRGAVPDVGDFQSYLQTYLAVPSEHILVLTDEQATRAAIIQALRDLAEDERIARGDAILIYYAGHGTELAPPTVDWEAGGRDAKIQAIVPYDCSVSPKDAQPDVPPIPDHLLENLLANIAETKGDNITVILDCCHSTSGTRALPKPSGHSSNGDVRVRAVTYTRDVPQDLLDRRPVSHLESLLPHALKSFIPQSLRRGGLSSHVLLAACSATEKAHEENGHGRFSAALLQLLKSVPPNKLRYSDILGHKNLGRIKDQNPHCEGIHKDRALFNAEVLPTQHKSFRVRYRQQRTANQCAQYTIDGGKIHGLASNTKFDVYRKNDTACLNRIGILHADQVDDFMVIATLLPPGAPEFDTDIPTIAIQTNPEFQIFPKIHIPPADGFHGILKDLSEGHLLRRLFDDHIPLADHSENAHAKITVTDERKVNVTILDTTHGLLSQKLSPLVATFDPDPDDLAWVLSRIANFYREVKLKDNNPGLISVELYELKWVSGRTIYGDDERWLQPDGPNLCTGGTIFLNLSLEKSDWEEKLYGMKIINNSPRDLDVNVYRFNHDFSISPLAESGASQSYRPSPELPLKRSGGSLAIGYGAAGYPPLSFKIQNGLDVEVVFLKIYVATRALDVSHLSQASPFANRGMSPYQRPLKTVQNTWTDIVIPMVLRRHRTPLIPDTRGRR